MPICLQRCLVGFNVEARLFRGMSVLALSISRPAILPGRHEITFAMLLCGIAGTSRFKMSQPSSANLNENVVKLAMHFRISDNGSKNGLIMASGVLQYARAKGVMLRIEYSVYMSEMKVHRKSLSLSGVESETFPLLHSHAEKLIQSWVE